MLPLPSLTSRPGAALNVALVALVALAAIVLSACSGSKTAAAPAAAPPAALPVTVIEARAQNLPTVIELIAQTEGAKETEVRSRVGGILVKRLYDEGTVVKAGQPLFQIDRAPYENALAETLARAEQTTREAARLKGLLAKEAISQREYDEATTASAITQAALRQAQLNLSWTVVSAPVAGTTGRALKSEGSLISVGDPTPLTSVYQSDPMWARFGLSESDTAGLPGGQLKPGMVSAVELILPDGSLYGKPGKVNFLASTIDPTLGTRQLRAEFDNKGGQLLPGQFVRVRLLIGERKNVFLVPQAAVVQTEKARLVMLAGEGDKVTPRPVETAEWRGQDWVITKGLQNGDRIIIDNVMKLRPGASVVPRPPQAAPGAAPATPAGAAPSSQSKR